MMNSKKKFTLIKDMKPKNRYNLIAIVINFYDFRPTKGSDLFAILYVADENNDRLKIMLFSSPKSNLEKYIRGDIICANNILVHKENQALRDRQYPIKIIGNIFENYNIESNGKYDNTLLNIVDSQNVNSLINCKSFLNFKNSLEDQIDTQKNYILELSNLNKQNLTNQEKNNKLSTIQKESTDESNISKTIKGSLSGVSCDTKDISHHNFEVKSFSRKDKAKIFKKINNQINISNELKVPHTTQNLSLNKEELSTYDYFQNKENKMLKEKFNYLVELKDLIADQSFNFLGQVLQIKRENEDLALVCFTDYTDNVLIPKNNLGITILTVKFWDEYARFTTSMELEKFYLCTRLQSSFKNGIIQARLSTSSNGSIDEIIKSDFRIKLIEERKLNLALQSKENKSHSNTKLNKFRFISLTEMTNIYENSIVNIYVRITNISGIPYETFFLNEYCKCPLVEFYLSNKICIQCNKRSLKQVRLDVTDNFASDCVLCFGNQIQIDQYYTFVKKNSFVNLIIFRAFDNSTYRNILIKFYL
ncbi:hypothetical protein EDEG_00504 [Edhazardia aedis USNM 41457]|uniref:Telomeric single stranded DNA binding POT1/Cdc13 domain-containing protein n=1 Tax=Edhazardia aedis (strain USNM 41457) TaxID=1003232 RepID=J9DIT7_EDHAE|nr:hypothetical protein EDEG_00504 [Edhazardia aedis USNM 41457]|eukprot:EJW01287.1 hypothetical protein EDEG_00504 [Edhazardia aedis USNM 41457]